MAKKSSVEKAKRREDLVSRNWNKRLELRKRSLDVNLPEEERYVARQALDKMSPNTSSTRIRNRCQLTGRSRGYLRKFKMSRLCFREFALRGLIPGLYKASW